MQPFKTWMQILVVILSSITMAIGYNYFLLPHKVLSGGITGISMILGMMTPLHVGVINFLINVPIVYLGYRFLGRRFIFLTMVSIVVMNASLLIVPVQAVATDPLLSTVFGGVIVGLSCGLIMKFSGSSGGLDIISLLITKRYDYPVGKIGLSLNAVVVSLSGFLFDWQLALYTLVSIYVSSKTLDSIHTKHVKLTVMIVTSKRKQMAATLLDSLHRGVTVVHGEGAFSHTERDILYMVITRYELSETKELISQVDKDAFVNITETVEVMGRFHRT